VKKSKNGTFVTRNSSMCRVMILNGENPAYNKGMEIVLLTIGRGIYKWITKFFHKKL
jgi:hypothetical protein